MYQHLIDENSWLSISMSELDGQYRVMIDRTVVHSVTNNNPLEWESVDFEIAKPGQEITYQPTPGSYELFDYDFCIPSGKLIVCDEFVFCCVS